MQRVERQLVELREETARADTARAVEFTRQVEAIMAQQQVLIDSVRAMQARLTRSTGQFRSDHTEIQRQLIQIQELTGQSQQRLSDLRTQIQSRGGIGVGVGDTLAARPRLGTQADELFDAALQQLRRGSAVTARSGFQMFLDSFPAHPRATDAQFLLGEAWTQLDTDSAAAAYRGVVARFPDSPRAPMALFKLGVIAEQDDRLEEARSYFRRVLAGYPRSDEAALARERLQNLER